MYSTERKQYNMENFSIETLITIFLFLLFILSRTLLRITKKQHTEDPKYQEERRRIEEERRRRIEKENEDLRQFELLNEEYSDLDYSDNDYYQNTHEETNTEQ